MQINSVKNYNLTPNSVKKYTANNVEQQKQPQVAFCANEDNKNNGAKAMRNLIYGLMMLGATIGGTPALTSCDDGYAYAEADANVSITPLDSLIDSCHCKRDTIIKWYCSYQKPIPLDSLYNNMQNWGIDGTEGDKYDEKSKRNIIHYEGTREWEYGTKEIGDMDIIESSKNVLIYDTEIKDWEGKHQSYGKRVLRIPTGSFSITKKDGEVVRNPKGFFVEEYENPYNEKGGSVLDCNVKSRAFVTTNGDTLNVSLLNDGNKFVETGKVAKGYLGANSILLQNLIGRYETEDHYVDFNVDAITDQELRCKYVKAMDAKASGK